MIGHIYRIQHTQSNLVYVGSTFNEVKHRFQQHKDKFRAWNENDGPCAASVYPHFKEHGIHQFKCFLVKSYEVEDRAHLEAFETLWIRKLKACNRLQPFAIKKLTQRHIYLKDREGRCAKVRAYAAAIKDVIRERKKAYRERNDETIKAKKAEKITCECGGSWTKGHGAKRHLGSKKHQDWQAAQ